VRGFKIHINNLLLANGEWGADKKCAQIFEWKSMKGRNHFEDPDVDGRILSEWILK
jgi:hypothetical protein